MLLLFLIGPCLLIYTLNSYFGHLQHELWYRTIAPHFSLELAQVVLNYFRDIFNSSYVLFCYTSTSSTHTDLWLGSRSKFTPEI